MHGKNGFFVCLSGSGAMWGGGDNRNGPRNDFLLYYCAHYYYSDSHLYLVFSSLFSFPVGKFTRAERRRSCRPMECFRGKKYFSRSCGRGKSGVPPTDAKIAKLLNRILWDRLFLLPFNTFFDLMRSKKAVAKVGGGGGS